MGVAMDAGFQQVTECHMAKPCPRVWPTEVDGPIEVYQYLYQFHGQIAVAEEFRPHGDLVQVTTSAVHAPNAADRMFYQFLHGFHNLNDNNG
jgi:hypothetical protein